MLASWSGTSTCTATNATAVSWVPRRSPPPVGPAPRPGRRPCRPPLRIRGAAPGRSLGRGHRRQPRGRSDSAAPRNERDRCWSSGHLLRPPIALPAIQREPLPVIVRDRQLHSHAARRTPAFNASETGAVREGRNCRSERRPNLRAIGFVSYSRSGSERRWRVPSSWRDTTALWSQRL